MWGGGEQRAQGGGRVARVARFNEEVEQQDPHLCVCGEGSTLWIVLCVMSCVPWAGQRAGAVWPIMSR